MKYLECGINPRSGVGVLCLSNEILIESDVMWYKSKEWWVQCNGGAFTRDKEVLQIL